MEKDYYFDSDTCELENRMSFGSQVNINNMQIQMMVVHLQGSKTLIIDGISCTFDSGGGNSYKQYTLI